MLRRAAFSPNIKERADCSAALFTAAGELLVQAEHIPVHLGSMPASVRAAIDAFGDRIEPGEHVILNDPFAGGTHLNDVTLVAPLPPRRPAGRLGRQPGPPRRRRRRRARLDARRRRRDPAGGPAPARRCCSTPEVRALLLANSRTPVERAGDLDAQVGANVVGAERLAALVGRGRARRRGARLRRAPHARRPRRACPTARWTVRRRARLDRRRAPTSSTRSRIVVSRSPSAATS